MGYLGERVMHPRKPHFLSDEEWHDIITHMRDNPVSFDEAMKQCVKPRELPLGVFLTGVLAGIFLGILLVSLCTMIVNP